MIEKKRIQIRRDLEQNWVNINPILLYGEIGFDLTNNKIKIGDGERPWNILPYITNEVDLSGYYTKDEIDTILNEINTNLSNDYYSKEQVDKIIADNGTNYYTKEEVYTKEETNTEIQNAIDGIEFPEQQEVSNATITIIQGDNNQSFNLNQPDNQTIILEDKDYNWFGNEIFFNSLPNEQKVNGIYYLSDKINYKEDITGQPYIVYKTSQLLNDKPFATTNDLPKEWFGTQEDFDSLETYETNTTYYIETSGEGGGSDTNSNIVDIMALSYEEQLELINFVINNNTFPDINTLYTYHGYILNNLQHYSDWWDESEGTKYIIFDLYAHPKSYDIRFITYAWNEGKIYNDINEKNETEILVTKEQVDELIANSGGGSSVDLSNYYTKDEIGTILNDYYTKEQTYSKTEIDNIVGLINNELEIIING